MKSQKKISYDRIEANILTIAAEVVDEDDFMDEVLRAPVQHAETKIRNTNV